MRVCSSISARLKRQKLPSPSLAAFASLPRERTSSEKYFDIAVIFSLAQQSGNLVPKGPERQRNPPKSSATNIPTHLSPTYHKHLPTYPPAHLPTHTTPHHRTPVASWSV